MLWYNALMNEDKRNTNKRFNFGWLIVTLLFLCLSAVLAALARNVPGFAPFYTHTVYRFLQGTLGRFSNLFPFSLSEVLLYTLPVMFIVFLIVKLVRKKSVVGLFKTATVVVSLLLLVYQMNCGINYYSISFAEKEGFTEIENDRELLIEFCEFTAARLNESSTNFALRTDSAIGDSDPGAFVIVPYPSGEELASESVRAMENIGTIYDSLDGYYPRPKGLLNPRPFSNMGVTGIYSPFTIEANYNSEMTGYNLPFTACHELSHLRGFMNESEANFIAFLACINSDNHAFQRGGYMLAWVYAGNELYKVDREVFSRIRSSLPDDVKKELDDDNQFWDTYETKASEVQNAVNDEYLKQHGIPEGIQSYSRVVGLMLAWFAGR